MTSSDIQEEEFLLKANGVATADDLDSSWSSTLDEIYSAVLQGQSLIIYGPPGTGKTKICHDLINKLKNNNLLGKSEFVQFHHKFGYEDFIEGYAPTTNGGFEKKDGIFKQFIKNPSVNTKFDVFFIDEINRADITTTFGELLFLMDDKSKRVVKTSHFGEELSMPSNLVIVGTMNTADRNIGVIDFALRRRFKFIPLSTDYAALKSYVLTRGFDDLNIGVDEFVKSASVINKRISANRLMGRHMELGQTMWFPVGSAKITKLELTDLFKFTIIPQLEAYCGYGHEQQLSLLLNEHVATQYLTNKHITYEDISGLIKDLANKKE